ncbi:ATP-binding cassette, sub-B (MDR TAP), member 4, partial [Chytridiales sp. JEL 0842]
MVTTSDHSPAQAQHAPISSNDTENDSNARRRVSSGKKKKSKLIRRLKRWWKIITTDPDDLNEEERKPFLDDFDDEDADNHNLQDNNDDDDEASTQSAPLWHAFKYSTPTDRIYIALAILASAVTSTTTFTWTFIITSVSQIFTDFYINTDLDKTKAIEQFNASLMKFVGIMLVLSVVFLVSGSMRVYLWTRVSERTAVQLRRKLYHAYMQKDIEWFETHSTGELNTFITSHVETVTTGTSDVLGVFLQQMFTSALAFVYALAVGWNLALPLIGLTIGVMLFGTVGYRLLVVNLGMNLDSREKAGKIATEAISAIRTVKAFGGEKRELSKYSKQLYDIELITRRKGLISGLEIGFSGLYINATYVFGIWYGFKLYLAGQIGGLAVMQVLLLMNLTVEIFTDSFGTLTEFHAAGVALHRILNLIELDLSEMHCRDEFTRPPPPDLSTDSQDNTPLIEFKNVNFAYPSRPNVPVLQDFNLSIEKGQTVALVGAS